MGEAKLKCAGSPDDLKIGIVTSFVVENVYQTVNSKNEQIRTNMNNGCLVPT